jgi:ribonuclease P protein component
MAGTRLRCGLDVQRLKTRSQFQAVLAGKTLARTTHFALHTCPLEQPASKVQVPGVAALALFPVEGVWLGAMVPKRWAKRAVTRNAIKRQIYTVSVEHESALTKCAHVVRLRSGFDRALFMSATSAALKAAVRAELVTLLARAHSLP